MSGEHSYASGVEKMLFVLSRGFCYAPTCQNPVVRFEADGAPEVTVFIAHIRAARPNGPRWAENMDPEERRSFSNLLLLCKRHHTLVDSKNNEKKYPAETLEEWKRRREKLLGSQIKGLAFLTEDRLIKVLQEVAAGSRNEIIGAIERVHGLSREMKEMLKVIVDEPYRRPLVDPEAVTSLEHSAGMLAFLQDHTPVLAQSARAISSLADHNGVLIKFSDAVAAMPDLSPTSVGNWEYVAAEMGIKAGELRAAASQVGDVADKLAAAVDVLDSNADAVVPHQHRSTSRAYEAECVRSDAPESEDRSSTDTQQPELLTQSGISRRKLLLRGVALGAALILLIQIIGLLFFK
ncbi:hypothetical protein AB0C47_34180 [Micromonospora taraxaci]|uniref:hypothetical protein n=1 Tax=Micromonospora taraxaci TaxID=1316803 RepID=UPI0033F2AF1B